MALLKAALPLVLCVVDDPSCRARSPSVYSLDLADVMTKTLVTHFGNSLYFNLAADCLLADPGVRAELDAKGIALSGELQYRRQALVTRLEGEQKKAAKAAAASKRPTLVDKKRSVGLIRLLK